MSLRISDFIDPVSRETAWASILSPQTNWNYPSPFNQYQAGWRCRQSVVETLNVLQADEAVLMMGWGWKNIISLWDWTYVRLAVSFENKNWSDKPESDSIVPIQSVKKTISFFEPGKSFCSEKRSADDMHTIGLASPILKNGAPHE